MPEASICEELQGPQDKCLGALGLLEPLLEHLDLSEPVADGCRGQ